MRLNGLDWDQGHLFHPDERAILMKVWDLHMPWPPDLAVLLDTARSPLNPRWFSYGSFPLYLLKAAGFALSSVSPAFLGPDLRLVGRVISALFDTGTVALLFLLGRRLYGPLAGLLAATFASLAVLHVQLSHFYAVDVQLTFFIVLSLYAALRWSESGRWYAGLLTGAALGLALATKISALPLVIPVALAAWAAARPNAGRPDASPSATVEGASPSPAAVGAYCNTPLPIRWATAALGLGLALVVAALVFALLQPYAVLDWTRFVADTVEQSEMVRRVRDYPYTRQYIDTAPFLYQFQQLGQWGLGWPLALLGWAGMAWAGWRAARGRRPELLLLAFALPYGLLTGAFAVKFLRYLLPLVPLLCLFGAGLASAVLAWVRGRGSAGGSPGSPTGRRPALPSSLATLARVVACVALAAVLGTTLLYALAFQSIYATPHPAVAMAKWIREHLPRGSLILREHWEEGLPGLGDYPQRELPLYEPDTPAKARLLASELAQAEAVLFYSNRLYGTIPRLPQRYPLTGHYYRLLFAGELGFDLVHASRSFPRLGLVSLIDDTISRPGLPRPTPLANAAALTVDGGYADESFTVYDHPQSLLFRKTRPLAAAQIETLLAAGIPAGSTIAGPSPGLLLSPEEAAVQRRGGTWSDRFATGDTPAWGGWPLASWLLLIEAAALAAFPLAFLALRAFPDGGYLLAKPLGLLLLAYLTWLAASLRWVPFERGSVAACLALLALAGSLAAWARRRSLVSLIRRRWRLLVAGEVLFLAAFLLFYVLRLMNPDLWHPWRGGEKPMDFAYLNAVAKSTFFPPYDPWFAGGLLNYYYFGQVIIAVLLVGNTIPPAIGFNLAIPLLFALTVTSVFTVGVALASSAGVAVPARRVGLVGGLAALLVAVAGNLDGAAQLLEGLGRLSAPSGSTTSSLGAGLLRLARGEGSLPAFDFWRSSRMMPSTPNITEFPYFSFLFADLHAHVLALPFTVLAIGLAAALLLEPRPSARSLALPLAGLALAIGALRVTNSWDFPTYLLLGAGVLALVALRSRRSSALVLAGGGALALGLLATLLYAPFHDRYQLFYQGV
ncbi:MAG: glycosyltransferase family 39 protein, partial [Chloroflexi bacterium]|nr:glycosyltransferase family 39 protein [Chloroflexota bacterium]